MLITLFIPAWVYLVGACMVFTSIGVLFCRRVMEIHSSRWCEAGHHQVYGAEQWKMSQCTRCKRFSCLGCKGEVWALVGGSFVCPSCVGIQDE